MDFLDIILKFLSSIFMMTITIAIWHDLQKIKINFKSKTTIISIILLSILSIFNYYIVNNYIRIFVITIILMIFFKFIFHSTIQRCIITPIYTQLLVMVAELFFAIFITFIFKLNSEDIINTQFGQFFSNLIITINLFLLSKLKVVKNLYYYLLKITNKIKEKQLIFLSFGMIIVANLLTAILYYKIEFRYLLIFNTLLTLFCFGIMFSMFNTKNKYNKVNEKYNTTLNSLKEYESILDKYRVSSHENKNQLLTIRNMLPKTNKKTIGYIDTILDNKLKDDNKILKEVTKIPAGGLRGIIYSKVLLMEELNIKYELFISNEVKTVELIDKIDDNTMLDVCKIIGVYLDNSIQAVEKLKNKNVSIELYIEDSNLNIKISNNYKGNIDISKLEDKGYTTKEKGHGYGLSLTKELIDNNSNLSNEKEINKKIFSQILKIKM